MVFGFFMSLANVVILHTVVKTTSVVNIAVSSRQRQPWLSRCASAEIRSLLERFGSLAGVCLFSKVIGKFDVIAFVDERHALINS